MRHYECHYHNRYRFHSVISIVVFFFIGVVIIIIFVFFFYIISARIHYEIKLFWHLVLDFMEGILLRKNSDVAVLLMLWQVFLLSFLCN